MDTIQTTIETVSNKIERLKLACVTLARVCDGAINQDMQGFNKPDSHSGHLLAYLSEWNNLQARDMCERLKKYKYQLESYNIDISDIKPEDFPVSPEFITPELLIDVQIKSEKNIFQVIFPYSSKLVKLMKDNGGVYGAKYYNDSYCKFWCFDKPDDFRIIRLFEENEGFVLTNEASTLVQSLFDNPFIVETLRTSQIGTPPAEDQNTTRVVNSPEAEETVSPVIEEKKPENRIENDNGVFVIYFPFSYEQLAGVKNIQGRKFNPNDYDDKVWIVTPNASNYLQIESYITQFNVFVDDSIKHILSQFKAVTTANFEESKAEDANIEVNYGVELFPFQKAGVKYSLRTKRTFIADEPGLGKTHQSIATVNEAKAFPCLVVTLASVKYHFKNEVLKGNSDLTVSVWGKNGGKRNTDVVIINYDILDKHKKELLNIGFKSVIFDESHYLKSSKSKRSKAAKEIAKAKEYVLCLTGTPIINRPNEIISQLDIMNRLDDFGGFWTFAKRYCNAHQKKMGKKSFWDLNGASNLKELNDNLRRICYIRRAKKDVFSEMPKVMISNVVLGISNREEYDTAEADVFEFLDYFTSVQNRVLTDAEFLKKIAELSPAEQEMAKANRVTQAQIDAQKAEAIVRINTLRKLAGEGKIEETLEWMASILDSGEKLVMFANHIEVQKALVERFPSAARIFGEDSSEDRQKNIERFQNDKSCNLIVCSLQAGGTGVDGLQNVCSNVAFIEQGWTPAVMEQAISRLDRFGQKGTVNAYMLIAENTIDLMMAELLESKRIVCEQATDGKEGLKQTSILKDLLSKIQAKQNETK